MIRGNAAVFLLCALLGAALGGCATAPSSGPVRCPLADQKMMTLVRLYFGRDVAGRGSVADTEWSNFARDVLTPQFPDGFTTFHGNGQWLDRGTHQVVREDSVVVEIAVDAGADYSQSVSLAMEAYKRQFHQKAVGIVTEPVCARF